MYPWDVGVAPYVRPGLSPWYDTTDVVVPQKSCRLLLALSCPKYVKYCLIF